MRIIQYECTHKMPSETDGYYAKYRMNDRMNYMFIMVHEDTGSTYLPHGDDKPQVTHGKYEPDAYDTVVYDNPDAV